jgi:YVTN family beta-propeller protein
MINKTVTGRNRSRQRSTGLGIALAIVLLGSFFPGSLVVNDGSIGHMQAYASTGQAEACNCVIFRFDDVQDHFVYPAQLAVMDLFIMKNQSLSLGIIMNKIGDDPRVVEKIAEGDKKGLFELVLHGWDHDQNDVYSKLTLAEQKQLLSKANAKMKVMFGSAVPVFIPPSNAFNEDTLAAMEDLGIQVLSSEVDVDKYSRYSTIENAANQQENGTKDSSHEFAVLHIPATTAFKSKDEIQETSGIKDWVKIPVSRILNDVESDIAKYGYAVIMLHPQDFVKIEGGKFTKIPDPVEMHDLAFIMDRLSEKGIRTASFTELVGLDKPAHKLSPAIYTTPDASTANVFTLGKGPAGIAIDTSTNMIYVTNSKSDSVSVIDGLTHAVDTSIPVGSAPFGIAVNSDTNKIYVINWYSDSVSVIDGSTNSITGSIKVGEGPAGIAIDTSTNMIYVTNSKSDSVSVIDGSTNSITGSIKVGEGPAGIAFNEFTEMVYVANTQTETIMMVNPNLASRFTNQVISTPYGEYTFTATTRNIDIDDLSVNPERSSLEMIIKGNNGEVELTLPKSLIDGIYLIQSGDEQIPFEQVHADSNSTTIRFAAQEDARYEILGTRVVPEFSAVGLAILGIPLMAVIISITLFQKKLYRNSN